MLKRLELKNVGPSDALAIDFAPRVNLLTGDNGLGKSFLLDVAWWALTGTWVRYPALPNSSQGATIASTLRRVDQDVSVTSRFDRRAQSWSIKPGLPGMVVYAQADGGFAVFDLARNRGTTLPNAYLFRPADLWDGLARPGPKDAGRPDRLSEGLIRDWASWQRQNGTTFHQLQRLLRQLSPDPAAPLSPGELTRISLDDVRDMPTLKTSLGDEVAIVHASAAIQRIAALAYLLVWTWHEHQVACKLLRLQPTQQMILLIDEVEAHLHPTWQERLLRALLGISNALDQGHAVALQIIAATHSLIVLASLDAVFDPQQDARWHLHLSDGDHRPRTRATRN